MRLATPPQHSSSRTAQTRVGIFYSSTGGTTRRVVDLLAVQLADATIHNVMECKPELLLDYDVLILGGPTYGRGELHDGWKRFLPRVQELDLTGKEIALFCLADRRFHPRTYAGSLAHLRDGVASLGGRLHGAWPADGYTYTHSPAVDNHGNFPGLVVDEMNESELTLERTERWLGLLTIELGCRL